MKYGFTRSKKMAPNYIFDLFYSILTSIRPSLWLQTVVIDVFVQLIDLPLSRSNYDRLDLL
jgi:hypothetical protein